jgi:urease accessory protein
MKLRIPTVLWSAAALSVVAVPASAHEATGIAGGFVSGFTHPLFGLDHLIAMVAVGLWGAFLGRPAIWLLPVVFPLVMAFGGVLGVLGVPVPQVETGIAVSAIVLGLAVALALKPPLWVSAVLVGAFAIFHGHAHGAELPSAADPIAYSAGFVISTGLLHIGGILLGTLAGTAAGRLAVRAMGGAIALGGAWFLLA